MVTRRVTIKLLKSKILTACMQARSAGSWKRKEAHACLLLFLLRKNKRSTRLSPFGWPCMEKKRSAWSSAFKIFDFNSLHACCCFYCVKTKHKIVTLRVTMQGLRPWSCAKHKHGFPKGNNQARSACMQAVKIFDFNSFIVTLRVTMKREALDHARSACMQARSAWLSPFGWPWFSFGKQWSC